MIISVSGAEGLSSTEMVTPSGIYIRDPTNVVEVRSSAPRTVRNERHKIHSGSYPEWQHQWWGMQHLLAAQW